MTAQVEFFCSPDEERDVLRYLTKDDDVHVFSILGGSLSPWNSFSVDEIPDWPDPFHVYLYQPDYGDLIWHTSQPEVAGPTHRSLVINLFAREEWDKRKLSGNDKMLDTDQSPIACYQRGTVCDGQTGPNLFWAPPSSLRRVGLEYERSVKRSLAWIRRRGTIVHDYREQSTTIPNPHSIVSTIYAFQDVLKSIESNNHKFTIL